MSPRRGWRVTIATGSDTFATGSDTIATGSDTFAYKLTGCGGAKDMFVFVNRSDNEAQVSGLSAGASTELLSDTPQTGGAAVSVPARGMKIFKTSRSCPPGAHNSLTPASGAGL